MAIPATETTRLAANAQTGLGPNGGGAAHFVQLVRQAFRNGKFARGCAMAHSAIEHGIRHPSLYYFRGLCKGNGEEYQQALVDFDSALALAPDEPALLDATGHCLTMLGRYRDAVKMFDRAIAILPDHARAHYRKGVALGLLNEIDDMLTAHRRVLQLEPHNADALASVAFISARRGETADARDYGERAIAISPGHCIARIALAMADIHEESFDAAEKSLSTVLTDSGRTRDGALNMALGFAADAFDRRGQFSRAFCLYTEVNKRRFDIHAARFTDRRAVDQASRLLQATRRCDFHYPGNHPAGNTTAAGHVFLLGFVRSGTTLLEAVLASNPSVIASDEHDFLADPAKEFLGDDDGFRRLASLDPAEILRQRCDYWNRVRHAGFPVADRLFVDKVPMNSLRMPLIAQLFPDARIVLAIRDPRDVVLSAFRHRFNMFPASFEFLRLEDCARFYASVMQLVDAVRERAPHLGVCEIRYEDLVAGFDRTVAELCAFVNIEWNESMREFQNASSSIDRRSQSAAQVRRGLYRGATEQWRNYASELAPVFPILAPWIARFGYPRD